MESRPVDTAERLIKSVELSQSQSRGSGRFKHILMTGAIGLGIGIVIVSAEILVLGTFIPDSLTPKVMKDLLMVPPLCAAMGVALGWPKKRI